MKFQDAFISIVVVTLVLAGVFSFVGDISIKHNQTVDWNKASKLNSTYARIENMSKNMDSNYQTLSGTDVSTEGSTDNPFSMISGAWRSFLLIAGSWMIFSDLILGVVGYLNLPAGIAGLLNIFIHGLIIMAVIVMTIYAFWKWKVET